MTSNEPGAEMWTTEVSIVTSAAPEAIWRLWADVAGWPTWNPDIERITLDGPFESGSTILMTPVGQQPVELRIADAVEPELFVDEADFGEIVIRTIHRAERLDTGRLRVVYRMEITGPGADALGPEVGSRISADFPETLAALVEHAEATAPTTMRIVGRNRLRYPDDPPVMERHRR